MQNVQFMLIMFPKCFPDSPQSTDNQYSLAAAQAAVEEYISSNIMKGTCPFGQVPFLCSIVFSYISSLRSHRSFASVPLASHLTQYLD